MKDNMVYEAKIIADSICEPTFNARAPRLTTFVIKYPRIVLAELNTHRMFSRNSASSRAIPVQKMIDQVMVDPFIPVYWGKNKPGMQAAEELSATEIQMAKNQWLMARNVAVEQAKALIAIGLHKQIANRILEPWMWTTSIVTATEWGNFFNLRCHPAAQPEIKRIADMMLELYKTNKPDNLVAGDWHLPFVLDDEMENFSSKDLAKLSVARCARVSYNNHDGTKPDRDKDFDLHDRLLKDGHCSPFEHQAYVRDFHQPEMIEYLTSVHGNFASGWVQYRKTLLGENREDYLYNRTDPH